MQAKRPTAPYASAPCVRIVVPFFIFFKTNNVDKRDNQPTMDPARKYDLPLFTISMSPL